MTTTHRRETRLLHGLERSARLAGKPALELAHELDLPPAEVLALAGMKQKATFGTAERFTEACSVTIEELLRADTQETTS